MAIQVVMISVIVVGRNDNYGVNLHKRTAISINALASILHDPSDEIIYVDCNTDSREQTLLEAIADTLTPRAREITRSFRITGEMMAGALGVEGVRFSDELSRNVAIRRSNPSNEWILSTNCDIIILPVKGESLGEMLRAIPPRFHVCPRVSIPYEQWWLLDRAAPESILQMCEATLHAGFSLPREMPEPWLRFQSIGDFQLAPRKQWMELRGCEEAMIHRGHSDTNNSKRLSLLNGGGRTPDLLDHIRAFHLEHNFPSVSHPDQAAANDRGKWVEGVTDYRSGNKEDWGLAGMVIPEISLNDAVVQDGAKILSISRRKRSVIQKMRSRLSSWFWRQASALYHFTGLGK